MKIVALLCVVVAVAQANIFNDIKDMAHKAGSAIDEAAHKVAKGVEKGYHVVEEKVEDAADKIATGAKKGFHEVEEKVEEAAEHVKNFANGVVDKIKKGLHSNDWTDLKVTWDLNPFNKNRFLRIPRTESAAKRAGWDMIGDGCATETNFLGRRYRDPKNMKESTILLFDNGVVVGIQTRLPAKNLQMPLGSMQHSPTGNAEKALQKEGDNLFLTAYFTNPSKICSGDEGIPDGKTASGLYLQFGPNPKTDFVHVPRDEKDVDGSVWGRGKCAPTMGKHYWYQISDDMDCDSMMPFCILYNNHKLDGFCFATPAGGLPSAEHYEHPSTKAAGMCCMDTPKCFNTAPVNTKPQTTLHVFFTNSPSTGFC